LAFVDFEDENDDEHNRAGSQRRSLSLFIEVAAPWAGH